MVKTIICPTNRQNWFSAGIWEQSMGARNRVGIGLSYRPARLHRLAKSVPSNRFLGLLKSLKIPALCFRTFLYGQPSAFQIEAYTRVLMGTIDLGTRLMSSLHGLINFTDTKAKCRHRKKLTCKGTLRQMFLRIYRLEIP
jgi:hypothetical protein